MGYSGIFASALTKLAEALNTAWGFFVTMIIALFNFILGYKAALIGVIVVVLMDAFWGVRVAIKNGSYAKSELLRNTVTKLGGYASGLLIFMLVENIMGNGWTYGTDVVAALIIICELWSIVGNILIINPNLPLFRMLKKALTGEISRKLGITEDEVKECFNESEKEYKNNKKKITLKDAENKVVKKIKEESKNEK